MAQKNIMKQALDSGWQQLPPALQAHYQDANNVDEGFLNIEYPGWMQGILHMLYLLGALLNRRGRQIPARVEKTMHGDRQYWQRTLTFDEGPPLYFSSRWIYAGENKLIEYVNPVLGLCMSVRVSEGQLYYEGEYFVLRLGSLRLRLPEWLLLGHTTITEWALDEQHFAMDFRLNHPLFGQIYRYSGEFSTTSTA